MLAIFLYPALATFRHVVYIEYSSHLSSNHPIHVSIWPTSTKKHSRQGQHQDTQQLSLQPGSLLPALAGALTAAQRFSKSHFRGDKEEPCTPYHPQPTNAEANSLQAKVWAGRAPAKPPCLIEQDPLPSSLPRVEGIVSLVDERSSHM